MNEEFIKSGFKLPDWYMDIKYNAKIFPNFQKHNIQKHGCNCQVYAYEILRYNNFVVPDLRSSEMWEDIQYSSIVENLIPGDLVFFNNSGESWGAHVGLYIGDSKILHNTNKTGRAVIWKMDDFSQYSEYSTFLGAKRFTKK